MKNRTKIMFADELEHMLATIPLDKIRVLDLCKRCGATPPTFYYHFHDKYELVAWIFLRDFTSAFADKAPEFSPGRIMISLKRMSEHRIFYQETFNDEAQNTIDEYIQNFNVKITAMAVKEVTGKDMTSSQELLTKYHSYGIMGLFKEWINGTGLLTMEKIADFQYKQTPDFIKYALNSYEFKSSKILKNFN